MRLFGRFVSCSALVLVPLNSAHAETITVDIPTRCDLFDAGDAEPSRNGFLPVELQIPRRTLAVEFPLVTGAGSTAPSWPVNGPDGGTIAFGRVQGTNILSTDGVSGLKAPRYHFLAGVFLANDAPLEALEPPRLDFTSLELDFADLAPLTAQSFFIGDGQTAGGFTQSFKPPAGATRLFLGLVDGFSYGWPDGRTPSGYVDNMGSFIADVSFIPAHPADADLDDRITYRDLLAYLSQFRARSLDADRVEPFDQVTVQDLIAFLQAFSGR